MGDISCETMANLLVSGPPDYPPLATPDITLRSTWPYGGVMDINGSVGDVAMHGGVSGQIEITGDVSSIWSALVSGTIDIGRDLSSFDISALSGTISVGRDLSGSSYVNWGYTGQLVVERDLVGYVEVRAVGMDGSLLVNGDLTGHINVSMGGDLTGSIAVQGDVRGPIWVTGDLDDSLQDLTGGHIIVNGSLTEDGDIYVLGSFIKGTEFIAIDYDGWDEADTWETEAVIKVDGVEYTENTPVERIWEITGCKADMNNDGLVDFFDIDPFVQALNYPDQYALDYAGLAGSRVFHGDLDCDDDLDFFDIDPFVARITEGCCDHECGDCPERFGGEGGGEWLSPLEMAIELATHIAPERYDTLVDMIADLAAAQKDAEKAAYWTAVWEALTE